MTRLLLVTLALLSLAACNKQGGENKQAAGEILEGSVSDAMIASDQVRSEGPYAAPKAAKDEKGAKPGGKKASAGSGADAVEADATAAASAAPSPQPTPTPETTG